MNKETFKVGDLEDATLRCSFPHATIPTRLVLTSNQLHVIITVRYQTWPHELKEITHRFDLNTQPFGVSSIATFQDAIEFIRQCVSGVWQHELEEAMHVDGVRYADPHKPSLGGPTWTTYRLTPHLRIK